MPSKRTITKDEALIRLKKGGRYSKFMTDDGRSEHYADSGKLTVEDGEAFLLEHADKLRECREVKTIYGREWEYRLRSEFINPDHKEKLFKKVREQKAAEKAEKQKAKDEEAKKNLK